MRLILDINESAAVWSTSRWCLAPELARLLVESKADLQQQTVREPNGWLDMEMEKFSRSSHEDIRGEMSCQKTHLKSTALRRCRKNMSERMALGHTALGLWDIFWAILSPDSLEEYYSSRLTHVL